MKRVAIIGAILENPKNSYNKFNDIVKDYQSIIRGRMGLPFKESKISVISLTVVGTLDEINSLTGKLGNLENISVKTSISKKEICD
ncbi:TM1266 family iron-only hydrogenase system putative regulator [Helicovermis profundi]|uniref:TM1266 family iron-only hydrogenase system putative regulator n=1 Tax=Helicovermis profundi TaxID=3065157 RepID=UPI0030CB3E45